MDARFEHWLLENGYDPHGAASRVSNVRRVETAYGDPTTTTTATAASRYSPICGIRQPTSAATLATRRAS
jgi:hypothetical protein